MYRQLVLSLVALTMTLSTQFARAEGPANGGGGNTVNHQLIEDYAVVSTRSDLPGFAEVEPYLKIFDDRIPGCGKELRGITDPDPKNVDGVVWYLLPEKITTLPASVTGLDFTTEQPAMQIDQEIFVSAKEIANDSARTRGELYLHETLMMDHPTKSGESVRKLMIYLKRTAYAPKGQDLSDVLKQLGFKCGWYQSNDEKATLEKNAKDRQAAFVKQAAMAKAVVNRINGKVLRNFTIQAQAICASSANDDAKYSQLQSLFDGNQYFYNTTLADVKEIPSLDGDVPEHDLDRGTYAAEGNWIGKLFEVDAFDSLVTALGLTEASDSDVVVRNKEFGSSIDVKAAAPVKKLNQWIARYQSVKAADRLGQACGAISNLNGVTVTLP